MYRRTTASAPSWLIPRHDAGGTQSMAMASRNKLDHDVTRRCKTTERIGYPATLAWKRVGGYHTLAEAFRLRDSPPHKANMLKNGVTKLGIAASYAPKTKYKVFWTLILASSEPAITAA